MSACASLVAGFIAEPSSACPSMPSSVIRRSRPSALLPANLPVWAPYVVGGMPSQANSVSVTSVIFMVASARCVRKKDLCYRVRSTLPQGRDPHDLPCGLGEKLMQPHARLDDRVQTDQQSDHESTDDEAR